MSEQISSSAISMPGTSTARDSNIAASDKVQTLITVPIPATVAPAVTKVTTEESRRILDQLEKRIAFCERFIGNPQVVREGLNVIQKEEALDPLDSRQKEWLKDVEFSIDNGSLVSQIEWIRRLTDQLFIGRPAEFEKKCKSSHT